MAHIMVLVDPKPTTGFTEMFEAKLPQNERWYAVQKTLRVAVEIHIAGEGCRQGPGGRWKYQLLSRDRRRVINKTATYLTTDEDYRRLVRTVKGEGKETPLAVLTQDKAEANTAPEASNGIGACKVSQLEGESVVETNNVTTELPVREKVVWCEDQMAQLLDEDGNPYFDPYDPEQADRVAAKWGQEHPGSID